MKIESLNLWGGRLFKPLMEFVSKQAKEVDVFCFQEVYNTSSKRVYTRTIIKDPLDLKTVTNNHHARTSMYSELVKSLPNFQGFFHSTQDHMDFHGRVDYDLHFGQATFVRKDIPVINSGDVLVHGLRNGMVEGDWTSLPRNMQYVQFEHNRELLTVANLHGIHGDGKIDTPARLVQARNVKEFLESQNGEKILCGDFNLLPDTQSMRIMEKGMRNLIKEYKIRSTRSSYYDKPHMPYADYMIVSPGVTVVDLTVLQDEVSDHLPLVVEFE